MPENMILTLQQWRGLRGLNKRQLAEKSGITEKSIYNYEKDINNLRSASYDTIKSICDALDIKVSQIFLDDTSENPKQEVN